MRPGKPASDERGLNAADGSGSCRPVYRCWLAMTVTGSPNGILPNLEIGK